MADDGLEPRVVELETQVRQFSGELRDFRRATTAGFNAMRADITDLRQDMTDLRDHVDSGFMEMRGKFDAAATGQQQIVGLLDRLIADQG